MLIGKMRRTSLGGLKHMSLGAACTQDNSSRQPLTGSSARECGRGSSWDSKARGSRYRDDGFDGDCQVLGNAAQSIGASGRDLGCDELHVVVVSAVIQWNEAESPWVNVHLRIFALCGEARHTVEASEVMAESVIAIESILLAHERRVVSLGLQHRATRTAPVAKHTFQELLVVVAGRDKVRAEIRALTEVEALCHVEGLKQVF